MGFTELLTIVFVVLKLIGTIDWSWWLVLLPEIIAAVLYMSFAIVGLMTTIAANRSLNRLFKEERKHMDRF